MRRKLICALPLSRLSADSISVVDKAYAGQKVAPTRRHAMVVGGVTTALVLVGLYVLLELVATRRSRG